MKHCDICEKEVPRLTRRYKGEGYCPTCYSRYFKQKKCPKCGQSARLPIDDPNAICKKCMTAIPCTRCGKTKYRIGKMTQYGPVCTPCAIYFRPPKTCPRCGTISRRLSRYYKYGITEQVCPKCGLREHGTCALCHRFRRLFTTNLGKKKCKACLTIGEIPCPKCGKPMPAGRGNRCEECYYKELLDKRIKINCAAILSPLLEQRFTSFGHWLRKTVGPKKAALTINNYILLFVEIGYIHRDIPSYKGLLKIFGAGGLRRYLLPIRWMANEVGLINIDEELKTKLTEQRRIKTYLNIFEADTDKHRIINNYYKILKDKLKLNKTSLKSIRLSLCPATRLLDLSPTIPRQVDLNNYLSEAPGQRASLSGFITFLNNKYMAGLFLPSMKAKASRKKRLKSKQELMVLMTQNKLGLLYKKRLLGIALNYFHGLPISCGKTLFDFILVAPNGGINIYHQGQRYWLPDEVGNKLIKTS